MTTTALRFVRVCDAQAARVQFCSQLDCASILLGKVSAQLKFTRVVPVTQALRLLPRSSAQLIPRRAAVADCWFMQLLQAERLHEGSFPRESIGAGSWDPLRNLHSPLLPEILTVTTIHDISLYLWAGIPGYFQCCPEPLWWSASSFRFLNKCLCCHGAEHRANVSEVLRSW